MTGLNKFDAKDKRKQRRRNSIAHDLGSPKYRQRVIERKRIESGDDSYFFADRFYEDEVDW